MAQFRILPYSVNSLLRLHLLLYFVFKIAIGNREVFKLRQFTLFMLALSGLLLSSGYANASFSSTLRDGYNTLTDNVAQTWNEPEHYDLYIPAITWHARFAYDKEKTDKYNERPWGAGFGMSRWDDKGNWHGLYLMAFKDSFNKWEPIGGYGWEKPAPAGRRPLPSWPWLHPWRNGARQLELYPDPGGAAAGIDWLRPGDVPDDLHPRHL